MINGGATNTPNDALTRRFGPGPTHAPQPQSRRPQSRNQCASLSAMKTRPAPFGVRLQGRLRTSGTGVRARLLHRASRRRATPRGRVRTQPCANRHLCASRRPLANREPHANRRPRANLRLRGHLHPPRRALRRPCGPSRSPAPPMRRLAACCFYAPSTTVPRGCVRSLQFRGAPRPASESIKRQSIVNFP